jgi:hypothetical protein
MVSKALRPSSWSLGARVLGLDVSVIGSVGTARGAIARIDDQVAPTLARPSRIRSGGPAHAASARGHSGQAQSIRGEIAPAS